MCVEQLKLGYGYELKARSSY